jgi:hypothetical protein
MGVHILSRGHAFSGASHPRNIARPYSHPQTCSDAIIKDMTVKFLKLSGSQQWTDDEQRDHFCLSFDGVANDHYTLLMETSPNLGLKRHFWEV